MIKCELYTLQDHNHSSIHTSGNRNFVNLLYDLVEILSIVSIKSGLVFYFTDMQ